MIFILHIIANLFKKASEENMKNYQKRDQVLVLPNLGMRAEKNMMVDPDKALCDAVVDDSRETNSTRS